MQKRIPIKNHHHEILLTTRRSMVALITICTLIFLLIVRLAYLQIVKHDLYITLSTKNWLDLVPTEPTRGLIYDRNGILLAENIPVFSLDVIPSQVSDMSKALIGLKKIITLNDNDLSQFQKQIKQHRHFEEVTLKLRLSEEEVARFTENQYRFPGVLIKARLLRHYPYGENFSHVLGYVGRINTQDLEEIDQANYSASTHIGKLGIEKFYEEELHGQVGYEQVEKDASGEAVRVLKEIPSKPGNNLYLSLDSGLQITAEKALQGHRGAIVAIQPATGQVLAMVSEPAYDPNIFVLGISQKDYMALQQSPDRPLYDRALRGLYPLASTIKPYFALKALNDDIISPDDTIYDQGSFQLPNYSRPYRDWQKGHGTVDMTKAITVSCDTYFYQLAHRMGINRMDTILTQFGFGLPTGIDLDDELSGVVASPSWKQHTKGIHWYEGDTIISGIGQGYMQATPLQLANAVSALANRGKRFMPYLLLGEQAHNKPYIPQKPTPLDPVRMQDSEDWEIVISAMQEVINAPNGTAHRFGRHMDYTVAGKTGTAQIIARRNKNGGEDNESTIPERLRDHHLFIAFAPVENPQIAVAIVTENSSYAIETARAIFDYYLGKQQNANRLISDPKKTAS